MRDRSTVSCRHGLLLVDKPQNITSHQVVGRVRKIFGQKKVGHTGTLDPMATGLMAVLLGGATRLEPYLTKMDKTYYGSLQLGLVTDTDDITGQLLSSHPGPWPTEDILRQALAAKIGVGDQIPPIFSAIKVDGQRAYRAARAGEPLQLKARLVTAYHLEVLSYSPPFCDFRAAVASGFYIRSLVRDLGAELGVGATLTALRREIVGPWDLSRAISLDDLALLGENDRKNKLLSPAEALPYLPEVTLAPEAVTPFSQGRTMAVAMPPRTGIHKIIKPDGTLLGLGELVVSFGDHQPQGPFLRPLRVLNLGD